MAAIRALESVARKWATVTPQRAADYEAGVKDPKARWSAMTLAAVDAWKAGITDAIARNAFHKGVSRAGDTAWAEGAMLKGVARWGPGVQLAEGKYQTGFAPYHAAISRVTLPPRFARRDPRNMLRVAAIVDALKKVKEAGGGV